MQGTSLGKKLLGRYMVRAMTKSDFKAVEAIEKTSFENHWTAADFRKTVACPGVQGRVVTEDGRVVAFYVYEYDGPQIHVLNLVIHHDHRRQGLGTALMGVLKNRLSGKTPTLSFNVRETNLPAHLFLKYNGFRASRVDRGYFVDYDIYGGSNSEDAYCFSYTEECCGI